MIWHSNATLNADIFYYYVSYDYDNDFDFGSLGDEVDFKFDC